MADNVRTFRRPERAKGTIENRIRKKIAITFTDGMFNAINHLAAKNRVSFAEQVRSLCQRSISRLPATNRRGAYEHT